jgi:NitT/TauT family transport system substrate-binding protein
MGLSRMLPIIRLFVLATTLLAVFPLTVRAALGTTISNVVTIGYSPIRISLPLLVAYERGLFEKRGVTVRLERYETPQPLVESLAAGRLSVGGYIAMPILYSVAGRSKVAFNMTTAFIEDSQHPFTYLLRRNGVGSPLSAAELRGKRIGILPTVAFHTWLKALLEANGLSLTDVVTVPVNPSLMVSGISAGQFDALFAPDPIGSAVLAAKAGTHITLGKTRLSEIFTDPYLVGSFIFRRDFVAHDAHTTRAIVASLDEAIQLIRADQEGAKEVLRKFMDPAQRALDLKLPDSVCRQSFETTDELFRENRAQLRLHGIEIDEQAFSTALIR